jgi:hypothetical protein
MLFKPTILATLALATIATAVALPETDLVSERDVVIRYGEDVHPLERAEGDGQGLEARDCSSGYLRCGTQCYNTATQVCCKHQSTFHWVCGKSA